MRGFVTDSRCISRRRFVEDKPVEEIKKEPNPMQTKSYSKIMQYIHSNEWLNENESAKDALIVWYKHMVGRVTLGLMVNNLGSIYRETGGNPDEITKSIQQAADHGWFKFYKYYEPKRKTGQELANAHGGGAYNVEKNYEEEGVDY